MLAKIITITFTLIIFYFLFTKVYFLRDPKRATPKGNNIISPANGKVVAITKINKNLDQLKIKKGLIGKIRTMTSFLKEDGIMVSIMMNIHNVHIQRVPIDGTVTEIKHNPGKFKDAVHGAEKLEWLENENLETTMDTRVGKIKIIQIAGLLARRCVSSLKVNQKVLKGQKLGLIRLGSQVTIIMPDKARLKVKIGQKVIDGETIIADV